MNLQVHCEHCDKSLYRAHNNLEGVAVVLYSENSAKMFPGPLNESRMEFCDWYCVAAWANERTPV